MIVANVLALGFTVVFARVLGASGYGDLAVLLSSFIIMMVPGSALQIAAAREVSHDLAEGNPNAGAGVRRWLERLVVGDGSLVAVVAVPLRSLIAALINIDQEWAAAAIPVTAMLWMILSVLRGVLQGFQQYRTVAFSIVGEASSRIVFALILVARRARRDGRLPRQRLLADRDRRWCCWCRCAASCRASTRRPPRTCACASCSPAPGCRSWA